MKNGLVKTTPVCPAHAGLVVEIGYLCQDVKDLKELLGKRTTLIIRLLVLMVITLIGKTGFDSLPL